MACRKPSVNDLYFEDTLKSKPKSKDSRFGIDISLRETVDALAASNNFDNSGFGKEQKLADLRKINLAFSDKAQIIGKRSIVITGDIFGPKESSRVGEAIVARQNEIIPDTFRLVGGYYWTVDDTDSVLIYLRGLESFPFEIVDYDLSKDEATTLKDINNAQLPPGAIDSFWTGGIIESGTATTFATQQWILFRANAAFFRRIVKTSQPITEPPNNQLEYVYAKSQKGGERANVEMGPKVVVNLAEEVKYSEEMWKTFVNGGIFERRQYPSLFPAPQDQWFSDYAFEIQLPFSKKELVKFAGINKPSSANVDLEYNFFVESYEKAIKNVDERLLPNLYVISTELEAITHNKLFDDHINLLIGKKEKAKPPGRISSKASVDIQKFLGDYYESYAVKIPKIGDRIRTELAPRFGNLVIPISNVSILKKYEENKELYPMYAEIEFSTDKTTVFSDILTHSKFDLAFIARSLRDVAADSAPASSYISAVELMEQTIDDRGIPVTQKVTSLERSNYRTWNIMKWIENFPALEEAVLRTDIATDFTGTDVSVYFTSDSSQTDFNDAQQLFFKQLSNIIFVGKLRKLILDKFRTYEDMLKGKLAYSETVFYRIERSLNGKVIQSIYIANTNKEETLKYIDTQVRYNERYTYSIFAYQAVIGTKYRYDDAKAQGDIGWCKVSQQPDVWLVEVPYYTYVGTIVDDPPPAPDVELIPYKGQSDTMKAWLNGGIGDYYLDPVTILPTDEDIITNIRIAKNLDNKEKIRYKSDDHSGVFQVFRTEVHPSSYKDFNGKMIAAVNTDVFASSLMKASSAAYETKLKSNKKYWYCFRTVDNHGHISNPTAIFQVELVEDKGMVFPRIEVVGFKSAVDKEKSKSGRKHILIRPKLQHVLVNEEKTDIVGVDSVRDVKSVTLGVADESLWGKKFLVRFKSRQSGRMLELKLTFNNEFVRNN